MSDYTGYLQGFERDYKTMKPVAKLVLNEDPAALASLGTEKELEITIRKKRNRRSVNCNDYFHTLCRKLMTEMRKDGPVSFARVKNEMLFLGGQPEFIDGVPVEIITNIPVEKMMEEEELHCKLIGFFFEADGRVKNRYRVYRGSHTYNGEEMTHLIDSTIEVCKGLHIETATPNQLREMAASWESYRGKREGKEESNGR